jgi:hypothetical protein
MYCFAVSTEHIRQRMSLYALSSKLQNIFFKKFTLNGSIPFNWILDILHDFAPSMQTSKKEKNMHAMFVMKVLPEAFLNLPLVISSPL